ncbi:amino acid adenylation domain-containing protein, partial [Pleionea sp. CnH1-48]|uniref:non-ribosomal peptide synthetase n=1 Tax=Pleionea sp. CnH1-48 TaxID=2954494 RepID=UPI002097CF0F
HWQREWLSGEVLEQQLGYWQTQLEDVPVVHGLPLDFERPELKQYQAGTVIKRLPESLSVALQSLATQNNMTMFMILHAAFALLLSRHSNSQDIVIGTPVANRTQSELDALIGFFVNTLVLRTSTDYSDFNDYLEHVKQVNLDAQLHQDVPFEFLVEHCCQSRSQQHTPLFQVLLTMDEDQSAELQLPEVSLSPIATDHSVAKFDLELSGQFDDKVLELCWLFDTSLFTLEHIEQLQEHFVRLLSEFVKTDIQKVEQLPLLSRNEVEYQVNELNPQAKSVLAKQLTHQYIEQQVEKTPDNVAVICDDRSLTYAELNAQANQLAHYLLELGVKPGDSVGLCVERSPNIIVGMLAIFKAGGVYVPLDPQYPQERLSFIASDAQLNHVLTSSELERYFSSQDKMTSIEMDSEKTLSLLSQYSEDNLNLAFSHPLEMPAYIVYTSGSTGQPKGVLVEHIALASHLLNVCDYFQFNSTDTVLQLASYGFDTFFEQTLTGLIGGSRLVIAPDALLEGQAFFKMVEQHKVTITDLSPGYLAQITHKDFDTLWQSCSLTRLVVGGEALGKEVVQQWFDLDISSSCQLFNAYGPTEAVITSAVRAINKDDLQQVRMGQVFGNRQLLVLDEHQQLCPLGTVGELYIGGPCLAKEYINQPELTNKSFVKHPLSSQRLYRTGDRVRYLQDGQLVFVGREDDQVQIRGYRVELAEIEQQLHTCEYVRLAAVVMKAGDGGEPSRMVAFLELDPSFAKNSEWKSLLKEELQEKIPGYMMPSLLVSLESMPFNDRGKVDKKKLQTMESSWEEEHYIEPANDVETMVTEIWGSLLNIEAKAISVDANFFELGGHSLLIVRMATDIRQSFNLELPVRTLFEIKNLRELASLIIAQQTLSTIDEMKKQAVVKEEGVL